MSLSELQTIPGVGKIIAQYLLNIGIGSVSDLKGKNPEKLYAQSNRYSGVMQDRCLFTYLDVRSIMPNTSSMILRS